MAYVTPRKNTDNEVLLLLPVPLYTSSRVYYEEDLVEMGMGNVLDGFSDETRQAVLHHARTLAGIQPELAFHFLKRFPRLLETMRLEHLGRWVSLALDLYDSKGLNDALEFVLGCETHPVFLRHWGKGLSFQDVYGILLHYVRALGKEDIALQGGSAHYTDLTAIYLPDRVSLHPERDPNFLLYKVMVTHKFGQIRLGTFLLNMRRLRLLEKTLKERYRQPVPPNTVSDLYHFLHLFPEPHLARDLFVLADTVRIEGWMEKNLPGLYRDLRTLKKELGLKRGGRRELPPKSRVMEMLISWWLTGRLSTESTPSAARIVERAAESLLRCAEAGRSVEDAAGAVAEVYSLMDSLPEPYGAVEGVPYMGELRPEEAEVGRRRRRESTRLNFRQELACLLGELPEPLEVRIEVPEMERGVPGKHPPQRQEVPRDLLVNGNPVPIPEGMQRMIEEIYEDLGSIPSSYLVVSDDMSGHYFKSLCRVQEQEGLPPEQAQGTGFALPEHGEGIHVLDEWDYRRQGYRKRWAFLRESTAPSGSLQFAEDTLARYAGMIRSVKRQFERIRTAQTMLRRQKDGDDVDLDAAVEAFSDQAAGLSPSERLFVRLSREKRDIAAAFLIDLSGSTSGWINDMERAALLIMSEAMQVLRDRFAIYGFSGRTRKRCELFRIKGFDEPYGDSVKRRIANLRALEYTRLGPPIRRLTKLLNGLEARTRLLITLSDGKPDDYDGYKGDYGIEDTRQALIEARRSGVHPFCITIDKAEHSYLPHMYGPVNYIFIDDLSKLPLKVPEIYRKLTT